jgi:hypothetical protein
MSDLVQLLVTVIQYVLVSVSVLPSSSIKYIVISLKKDSMFSTVIFITSSDNSSCVTTTKVSILNKFC